MEVVYSAVVLRVIALEENLATLQERTTQLEGSLRSTRIIAFVSAAAAISAIVIAVWK
jgi:hypothetical protein